MTIMIARAMIMMGQEERASERASQKVRLDVELQLEKLLEQQVARIKRTGQPSGKQIAVCLSSFALSQISERERENVLDFYEKKSCLILLLAPARSHLVCCARAAFGARHTPPLEAKHKESN